MLFEHRRGDEQYIGDAFFLAQLAAGGLQLGLAGFGMAFWESPMPGVMLDEQKLEAAFVAFVEGDMPKDCSMAGLGVGTVFCVGWVAWARMINADAALKFRPHGPTATHANFKPFMVDILQPRGAERFLPALLPRGLEDNEGSDIEKSAYARRLVVVLRATRMCAASADCAATRTPAAICKPHARPAYAAPVLPPAPCHKYADGAQPAPGLPQPRPRGRRVCPAPGPRFARGWAERVDDPRQHSARRTLGQRD